MTAVSANASRPHGKPPNGHRVAGQLLGHPEAGHPERPGRQPEHGGREAPARARNDASSSATASQASGPITVSQDSSGRKSRGRGPGRAGHRGAALWPRHSRTRPATPSGASSHTSYGGSASATRAPLTAAPASRGPSPPGTASATVRRTGRPRPGSAGPVAVLVTVVRVLPGVGSSGTAGRTDTVSGLRRYNGREPATVPMVGRSGAGGPADPTRPRRRVRARTALRTDLVRPAAGSKAVVYWAVGPFPCLTPWVSPSLRATTAIGPGTRTALAHCAVPGPKPARVCRGGGFLVGVLWWTSLTLVLQRVPVNRPVTCADAQSRR